MFFRNKIDSLVHEQESLVLKKQRIEDKKNSLCSRLGIKKKQHEDAMQRLEDKALALNNKANTEIAEINRKLKKIKKQIKLEQEYYFSLTDKE